MLGTYVIAALVGYGLGSIPTGYLVSRARGVDIRQHGSGNIGATNVWRTLGRGPGLVVFFGDALKGLLAVSIARFILPDLIPGFWREQFDALVEQARIQLTKSSFDNCGTMSVLLAKHQVSVTASIVAAVFCILGHNFPVWLRFKGGKGIATTTGVLLGLMPLAVAVGAVVWAAAFFTLRYVSVASLLAAAALPVTVGFLWRAGRADAALFAFSLLAAALAFWRHRSNLQRLMNGTEPRFARRAKMTNDE